MVTIAKNKSLQPRLTEEGLHDWGVNVRVKDYKLEWKMGEDLVLEKRIRDVEAIIEYLAYYEDMVEQGMLVSKEWHDEQVEHYKLKIEMMEKQIKMLQRSVFEGWGNEPWCEGWTSPEDCDSCPMVECNCNPKNELNVGGECNGDDNL